MIRYMLGVTSGRYMPSEATALQYLRTSVRYLHTPAFLAGILFKVYFKAV